MAGGAVYKGGGARGAKRRGHEADDDARGGSRDVTFKHRASLPSPPPPSNPPVPQLPPSPRLFLVDGYALIYRAFFALISRPLTTSRGENTSAAWGVVNFLERLRTAHRPEYLAWIHDSGLSFRQERYASYKATREKLSDEL